MLRNYLSGRCFLFAALMIVAFNNTSSRSGQWGRSTGVGSRAQKVLVLCREIKTLTALVNTAISLLVLSMCVTVCVGGWKTEGSIEHKH